MREAPSAKPYRNASATEEEDEPSFLPPTRNASEDETREAERARLRCALRCALRTECVSRVLRTLVPSILVPSITLASFSGRVHTATMESLYPATSTPPSSETATARTTPGGS